MKSKHPWPSLRACPPPKPGSSSKDPVWVSQSPCNKELQTGLNPQKRIRMLLEARRPKPGRCRAAPAPKVLAEEAPSSPLLAPGASAILSIPGLVVASLQPLPTPSQGLSPVCVCIQTFLFSQGHQSLNLASTLLQYTSPYPG